MKKIATASFLTLSFMLSACSSGGIPINKSLESIHQPIVSQAQHQFDIALYGGDIAPSETQRFDEWLQAIGARQSDHIMIEDGSTYGSPAAAQSVRRIAGKYGAAVSQMGGYASSGARSEHIRIHLMRATAAVETCPDWSSKYSADMYNSTSSNYGCAINSNLAAMVADPNDLVVGKSSTDQNTAHGVRAIKSYRERPLSGEGELRKNETNEGGGQ